MCGINGTLVFDHSSLSVSPSLVEKMRDTMAHRGPDGAGLWISPNQKVGLGHRRLSIIDLSEKASQPMGDPSGRFWLTYNGEIYNHAELRTELIELGMTDWQTDHSDTEVVLKAYQQWGIECLQKFRGMFGFAIWDNLEKELILVRDRVGIKPVYYCQQGSAFHFASEIKALLKNPEQPREINKEGLFHYLSFLTTPAPATLFQGIYKLPSASWLRVRSNGDLTVKRYWDPLDQAQPKEELSLNDWADLTLETLQESVRFRKVSDVPVGVFLSGGIDSSTNAHLFSQGDNQPVKAFSIGYEGDHQSYQNELHYAQMMAKEVGAAYHEKLLKLDDLIEFLPRMVQLQDEPIADPVCVPLYYVSQLAKQNGVTVCQVGEGADELFWGYEGWKRLLHLSRQLQNSKIHWSRRLVTPLLSFALNSRGFPRERLRRWSLDQSIFWGGAEAFTQSHKKLLLGDSLQRSLKGLTSWDALNPLWEDFQNKAWEKSNLSWMSYLDLRLRLPELLLMRVDKMSMGVSLEGRVPFLDHHLVELAMSIPESIRTQNDTLKIVLKTAVRGRIPDEIIDRRKQGFGVPIHEWFMQRLGDEAMKSIRDFTNKTGLLNKKEVENLWDNRQSQQLWYLTNLALWWKEYF